MGMNETPSAERVHISFFGCRNAGKSSLLNAFTGQDLAVVSDVKGTTTDPVKKSMELLPLGPAVIIDTPGIDDEGSLGGRRVRKTRQILNMTDIAVLVADSQTGIRKEDRELAALFQEKEVPYVVAFNKCDLTENHIPDIYKEETKKTGAKEGVPEDRETEKQEAAVLSGAAAVLPVSARTGFGIEKLKETLAHIKTVEEGRDHVPLIGDLLSPSDFVVLVIPVDKAAPKGRLILPQQQTIRGILVAGAVAVTVKDHELSTTLAVLGKKPKLVVTDSQVFGKVKGEVPDDILLTSFSILFARYKGNLKTAVEGAAALDRLEDGAHILICEGCTHHRQCGDIGTEKLPAWIRKHTGKELRFSFTSGTEFPDDLSPYSLIIHCGGCMLNAREMKYRLKCAEDQQIPMTNYGIAIAHMNGILKRSVEPFPDIREML